MTAASCKVSANMPARYKAAATQLLACLLCLMIVGGSLDRVPDPPAVTSRRGQTNSISRVNDGVPLPTATHASGRPICTLHFHSNVFWFGQIFESKEPAYRPSFVRRASDASPPFFF
jgi:hypothetical protein